MVLGIIGENCSGKSTLAEKIKETLGGEIITGKDYLRMAKSESEAVSLFREKLCQAILGDNIIYVIADREHVKLLPDEAIKILVKADLETIKERFTARMHGNLPDPVALMLERKHGMFDSGEYDYRFDGAKGDAKAFCEVLKRDKRVKESDIRKPDVILLNGSSSAGKSSIAKALRQKLHDSGSSVIISLDDYLQMSANEPIWEDDVFEIMPHMCEDISTALRDGKTVIIDHVITSARIYHALNDVVAGYQMKTILVSCDVETLRRREAERGDRCAGSAEASLLYLYPKTGYDLCVDSCKASPAALAEVIFSSLS